ncbi:hypothetical protein D3C71_189480 [compost metagenome]
MSDNPLNITIKDTILAEWHERDRHHVALYMKVGENGYGDTIVQWWDEAYVQVVEDGFVVPRRLHASVFEYAADMGLLNPANRIVREPVPTGWVIVHEDDGALMTWRNGGQMVWSSEATDDDIERGAVVFRDETSAEEFFKEDVEGEELADNEEFLAKLAFHEVELDVTPEGHTQPRRVSAARLAEIGVDIRSPASVI